MKQKEEINRIMSDINTSSDARFVWDQSDNGNFILYRRTEKLFEKILEKNTEELFLAALGGLLAGLRFNGGGGLGRFRDRLPDFVKVISEKGIVVLFEEESSESLRRIVYKFPEKTLLIRVWYRSKEIIRCHTMTPDEFIAKVSDREPVNEWIREAGDILADLKERCNGKS